MNKEAQMVNLDDIKQMLGEVEEPTLTLYLNVDNAAEENQALQPAWKIWLKDTLRGMAEQNRADGSKEAWKQINQQVESYFEHYQPQSKSLVFFASPAFQRTIELPLSFENQAFYGKPSVAPLLWALDEYEPYLIVLVDQEKARFFISQLGSTEFEDALEIDIDDYDWGEFTTMANPAPGGGAGSVHGGSGKDDFAAMIGEHRNRFYRTVVEQMQKVADRYEARRIILGGSEEAAHALKGFMNETLAQRVIGVLPIPMRSTTQQIIEIALPHALEYERQEEMTLVNQVIDFAKSGGRGALGPKAVMEALDMQRVELLIMPYPMEDTDLAAELPLRAFASGGSVELVHGEAADRLKQEGGIAARLYYAM